LQSDSNKFARKADRNRKMATEGYERGGRGDHQQMIKVEMDKEITKIRVRMEELSLRV
jgi:hypothetical protein